MFGGNEGGESAQGERKGERRRRLEVNSQLVPTRESLENVLHLCITFCYLKKPKEVEAPEEEVGTGK